MFTYSNGFTLDAIASRLSQAEYSAQMWLEVALDNCPDDLWDEGVGRRVTDRYDKASNEYQCFLHERAALRPEPVIGRCGFYKADFSDEYLVDTGDEALEYIPF